MSRKSDAAAVAREEASEERRETAREEAADDLRMPRAEAERDGERKMLADLPGDDRRPKEPTVDHPDDAVLCDQAGCLREIITPDASVLRAFKLRHNDIVYEHKAVDASGRWIYHEAS